MALARTAANRRSKRSSTIAPGRRKPNARACSTSLAPEWQEFLSTKGQGLQTYLEDVQLAYKMLRDPQFQMAKETKTVLIIALLYIICPAMS